MNFPGPDRTVARADGRAERPRGRVGDLGKPQQRVTGAPLGTQSAKGPGRCVTGQRASRESSERSEGTLSFQAMWARWEGT